MFSDPIKNLKTLILRENNIVADLGAGTGHYVVAAGMLVPQGKVYAIDIVKDFLITIKNKVKDARLSNVECIWGNVEKLGGTKLADGIVDVAIASNILFQVEDRPRFVEEVKRIMKKGGKLLLLDWSTETVGAMPVMKIKTAVPKAKALEMFESKGFKLDREIDAGFHHYGMILIKQ